MGGSQPSSHLCFSLSLTAPFHFCCLPFPLFASHFCSVSGQRLIRPNPSQCLACCTGSLVMVPCALWCVHVQALGRRWDSAHIIVYLPLTSRWWKNVCLDTHSFSPTLFPSLFTFSIIPPVDHFSVWTVFVQNMRWKEGAEMAKKAEWDLRGSLENHVAVWVKPACVLRYSLATYVLMAAPLRLQYLPICIRRHSNALETLDTFSPFIVWGHCITKNLRGKSRHASSLSADGIDGRSIPTAGDNHSVSASTDSNSYLCLFAASLPQMTTGTCISFLSFQSLKGANVSMSNSVCIH